MISYGPLWRGEAEGYLQAAEAGAGRLLRQTLDFAAANLQRLNRVSHDMSGPAFKFTWLVEITDIHIGDNFIFVHINRP